MSVESNTTNQRNYIRRRTLSLDQLDKCLGNREVHNRFERYVKIGRTSAEGPMSETEALEEALMDVFVGARSRANRLFKPYAEEAHVLRLKRIMANTDKAMIVEEYVPDMVGLRQRLRQTGDLSLLTQILVAEQAGRNDSNEPRPEALRMILARIASVTDDKATIESFKGPSEEEAEEAATV